MAYSTTAILAVTGLICFGTTTSLFAKIIYDTVAENPDGTESYFRKPWMMTLVMFVGMSFCLPLAYAIEAKDKRKAAATADQQEPLLGQAKGEQHSELKKIMMLSIPTIFDLIATVLMNVGLLSVTASVYQMMRGAEMLFAALFAVVFLHRSLNRYHYGGILACTVGICVVGVSSVLSGEGSQTVQVKSSQIITGMLLIVASQCVQAAQITFEDFFMADLAIMPMKIVGFEGAFGVLFMVVIMMPIAYFIPGKDGEGLHEDTLKTLWIIAHNPHILAIIIFMAFALLMYNISGMNVTGELGAVFRTVLETMRTLFVWIIDLILHEGLGLTIGESWSVWSWLQLAGFVVLVAGTIIYSRGDEKEVAKEMEEALAAESSTAGGGVYMPGSSITGSMPIGMGSAPSGSMPIAFSASSVTKATMNINQFSSSLRPSFAAGSIGHRDMVGSFNQRQQQPLRESQP